MAYDKRNRQKAASREGGGRRRKSLRILWKRE